ncbi:MAG TPA: hypothetical protein VFJ64_10770 [Solirubrobacterales bacterium]|nr:hypothetical protein [Solirubrobacterales bacterium]
MEEAGTGGNSWPLKSASGENPTVTLGSPITFLFTDVPDRAPTGPLANYLPGCFLTIKGTLTQSGETSQAIPRDVLPSVLIDSIDWTQSFFGAVLSTNYVKGKNLPVVEFTANGFKYGQRQIGDIPATPAAYAFSLTVWIPAASDRRGRLISATSQLALLFQPSQLKINFAASGAVAEISPGASFSGLSCRVTADLDPRQELVLGTPMEWILHQIPAAGASVRIEGFGRNTAMTGVEDKGGVAFLGELTGQANQDGILDPVDITQLSFQWRGQGELQDIDAWVNKFVGLLPNDRPQQGGGVVEGGLNLNDYAGYPNTMTAGDTTNASIDLANMRFFPFVLGGRELRLTDLQTADQDQTYYLNGPTFSGTHQILAQYARRWQQGKRDAWEALVRASGLVQYVYGSGTAVSMQQRVPLSKHFTTPDQATYLPWALQP